MFLSFDLFGGRFQAFLERFLAKLKKRGQEKAKLKNIFVQSQ